MSAIKTTTQHILEEKLKLLFPTSHIHVNVRKEHDLKYDGTDYFLELDCWIPDLNLGFEFQDDYHYVSTWYPQRSQHEIAQRDNSKRNTIMQSMYLITVPCWWNGDHESLGTSIKFEVPNLELPVFPASDLIPLNPPKGHFAGGPIPYVGELMLSSFMPENDLSSLNLWWMGEKYDGVRLCWVAAQQKIYTRRGTSLYLPPTIRHSLPQTFLDSEIWFGRGQFHLACMIVNYAPEFIHWHAFRMVAFDNPFWQDQNKPFEERYAQLIIGVSYNHPLIL